MPFCARLTALALAVGLPMSPAMADVNAGAYLAARQAGMLSDYRAASQYYTQALIADRANPELLESTINAFIGLGQADRAVPVARRLAQSGAESQLASLVLLFDSAARGSWDALIDDLEAGLSVGPLFDGLVTGWAHVGAGRMGDALAAFDEVAESAGVEAFGFYHKALALAFAGDFEGAERILSGDTGTGIRLTRRGIIAYASILSQLGRLDSAITLLDDSFGASEDPVVGLYRERLEAGEAIPFTAVVRPADGVAEVLYSIGNALAGETSSAYTLIYARLAQALRPDHIEAVLLAASLLEDLERYELAVEAYAEVPTDDPSYHVAELGRAAALERSGRTETAIEVLEQLAESHGDVSVVHMTLGDTLRRAERFAEATAAYDRAIDLIPAPEPGHWVLYFARGITLEREDRWPEAEADFRKALELNPDQPQVLNYLGYSLVELQTNMDEALELIERAVAARPDSGYITDSLGWALYRLGRFEEAVEPMERAVELEPVDPIINDHLGDVYWAVGRKREAEFQWHRALSFDPEPENAERIRRKLEIGLDAVLEEEGAPPLRVANDEG